jgi:hypothetical protein
VPAASLPTIERFTLVPASRRVFDNRTLCVADGV